MYVSFWVSGPQPFLSKRPPDLTLILWRLKVSMHHFLLILRWSLIAMNVLWVGFRKRERKRERKKLLDWAFIHCDRGAGTPATPGRHVNELMNGPGTTGTAARATRAPRKQIARRGLIRPIYFVFESFRGDYAQNSWNWTTARGRRKTGYETKCIIFFLLLTMFDCVVLVI